jgi:hypothetical protein
VGEPALRALLISDDFVQRLVATVDNLGREHAPPRLWPARPTPGRFQVIERDGRSYANPDNALRYTPWVLMVEQLDPRAVVALYGRMLPLLQQAYEELGYPGQRFHTRLMAVIDQLLATPAAPELIALTLVEVKGEVPSERPWVRYEYADPAFEAASAGQKILLRVGAVNQRRLKAQLRALTLGLLTKVWSSGSWFVRCRHPVCPAAQQHPPGRLSAGLLVRSPGLHLHLHRADLLVRQEDGRYRPSIRHAKTELSKEDHMELQTTTYLVVGLSFALYIGIAFWARAGSTSEFYAAGGGVHPVTNGMATAADWMSAASFISMAGLISNMGYGGGLFLMGWTGGYVLLAMLLAPYLRKFGKFTVPEFIGDRFYSKSANVAVSAC